MAATGMSFERLKDGQTGYDYMRDLIKEYWKKNGLVDDVIFCAMIKSNNADMLLIKDVALVDDSGDGIEFVHDWWEGERYICAFWIRYVMSVPEPQPIDGREETT